MSDHHANAPSATTETLQLLQHDGPSASFSFSSSSSSFDPSPAAHDPPPPPVPSSDPRLAIVADTAGDDKPAGGGGGGGGGGSEDDNKYDLFKLKPSEALQLLSASVEFLVRVTGDIPPTPPPETPTNPQMSNMQVEKENIARSHSEKNLARLGAEVAALKEEKGEKEERGVCQKSLKSQSNSAWPTVGDDMSGASVVSAQLMALQQDVYAEAIDGVRLKHDPSRRPPPPAPKPQPQPQPQLQLQLQLQAEPYIIVGADSQPLNLQHGAITRKFYSKNEPPISVNQYLLRLHQFCPMSTAVYLATSLYIHRLAVEERAIPVTRRNAHRLVLAGLRVAMKALEDLSYPHTKIAKVGGVSDVELARLEISFCFLAGFELVVGEELLTRHWETLRGERMQQMLDGRASAL